MTDLATPPAAIPAPGAAEEGNARLGAATSPCAFFAGCSTCWPAPSSIAGLATLGRHLPGHPQPLAADGAGRVRLPVGALAAAPGWANRRDDRAGTSSARSSSASPGSCDFVVAWRLYGADHATATLPQTVLWRAIWGVFAYFALATGFTGSLQARRARRVAWPRRRPSRRWPAPSSRRSAASSIRTSCSTRSIRCIDLTRKDPQAAEAALMRFSGMLRYVLDTKRSGDRPGARWPTRSRSCATTSRSRAFAWARA